MASKQTEHYGLNLWEGEDSFLRAEFNEDNRKIDAAIKGVAEDCAAGLQELDGAKCRLVTGSYIGDGTALRTIQLGVTPKALIVKKPNNYDVSGHTGEVGYCTAMALPGVSGNTLNVVGDGFTVTNHTLVNENGRVYLYLAFL